MEAAVERIFSNDMIEMAGKFFGINSVRFLKLGEAENYVFEVYRDETPYILRMTHQSHRQKEQVFAELKWIEFLQNNGVTIPKVIPSRNNNLVEIVKGLDGSNFYCCLFEKAPGVQIKIKDEQVNEEFFYEWGKTIGLLHNKTKSYKPNPEFKRLNWYEEELLDVKQYHFDSPDQVAHQQKFILRQLEALPVHHDNFGLIHSDIHHGNFHYHEGKIFVFDFDDCSYHWFASDLAIPLYYLIWNFEREGEKDLNEFAAIFMKAFLKGYETENQLTFHDYETIPLFLKLRDLTLYSFFYKKFDLKSADEKLIKIVTKIEQRLIDNQAIIDLDFKRLLKEMR
ncbi:hypothetical protein WQ54_26495 [Bacillus sp. SA1-12]|uniref:phosphotransferase enzyme family protein n=1 Tax=Bacillus sp. SA1-12 TaxID=1455638 RepID=UPI000627058E|nr:phosphotransferase [Bacillus sp. SA1-12]KKI89419.1 hypothetical protein WQ54_26495 [Bacillus sp. SA1-12]